MLNYPDIYSLLNSKAISEHCRKIGHQFNPLEEAYIISISEKLTIAEKHMAFHTLIETRPDMEVLARPWTPHYDSLRNFLLQYIQAQNEYLDVFYRDEPNCTYSYKVLFSGDDDYCEDDRIYSSLRACLRAMQADIDCCIAAAQKYNVETSPTDMLITKRWINADDDAHGKNLCVRLDRDGNPMDLWQDSCIISQADHTILDAFNGLWLEIPTPFQRGDIVIERGKRSADTVPLVLDWLPGIVANGRYADAVACMRISGDTCDMVAYVYGQNNDGTIWHDHGPFYLNLEYCNKELGDAEKALSEISDKLKKQEANEE